MHTHASPSRREASRRKRTSVERSADTPSNLGVANPLYQTETLRPIVCLAFVFPLILVYEIGAIFLGHQALRSGIDQWLDRVLSMFGFGQVVILPLVTAGILIVFHHRRNDRWQFRGSVLIGMALESIGLGLILYWGANAYHQVASLAVVIPTEELQASAPVVVDHLARWATIISALGSGIYEELVFRVILLLPAIYWLHRLTRNYELAKLVGIVAISFVFAALHYSVLNPAGAQFDASTFLFRFLASVIFCFLFLFRGFGIAVGTHATYDILTQL